MKKYKLYISILLIAISSIYFIYKQDDCTKIVQMSQLEIEEYLNTKDKNILVTRIYKLGECKNEKAILVLKRFINSPRITHHIKFKGIPIGKIAKGAIKKIETVNSK